MPAIILDDYTVANALFRSDELTEGKWLTLAVLLFKCIVVGYVAALWPFWLAQWIPNTISLPAWFPWFLWIASVMAVAFVEPVMFIGFALLYIRESGLSSALEQKKPVTVECWGDALAILRTEKPAACTAGFFQEEGRETSVRGSLSAGWGPASALP